MGLYDRDYALAPEALERTRARGPRQTPRARTTRSKVSELPPATPPVEMRRTSDSSALGCFLIVLAVAVGIAVRAML